MLRNIRVVLAVLMLVSVSLLFLDFTGTASRILGWTARVQFLPAILSLNLAVVISLIVVTLLVGRVYCSVICPLGVFQDIVSWINSRRAKKNRFRFGWKPELKWLRYGVFALFVAALIAGIGSIVALLAPYSSWGRIVANLFQPLWRWGNNLLASIAAHYDSYAFYATDIWLKSIPTFTVALATFLVIGWLAWRGGRTYCNTICPVGTVLGFFSRYSIFRPVIRLDKCVDCGVCAKSCKASCIDARSHVIDHSRCVACMDCLGNCTHGAIRIGNRLKSRTASPARPVSDSRRQFLAIGGAMALAATAEAQKKVDGGLAEIEDKKAPRRATRIVPPGAVSVRNFARHCTGCQLCVSECPNDVLRPSAGLLTLMQPEMSYERGYCRPECTRCSAVCPTGAILPLDRYEKSAVHIGHAVWVRANCIPLTDGVECGNCARHCPADAIQMVPSDPANESSPKIPVVNDERCIGCGACENLCPSRPFSAIYVEGYEVHHEG